jgi:hypothetical protein
MRPWRGRLARSCAQGTVTRPKAGSADITKFTPVAEGGSGHGGVVVVAVAVVGGGGGR